MRYLLGLAAIAAAASSFTAPMSLTASARADTGAEWLQRVYDAGTCIVRRDRSAALAALAAAPHDRPSQAAEFPANQADCGEGVSAEAIHLRGAIAQALFFRDFRSFGEEPARSTPLVNLDIPVQDTPAGDRATNLYRWSDCVVRNDSLRVERFLQSRVGSASERAAVERLRPYMAACSQGNDLVVEPAELRSVLAQSAYQSLYRYWTRQLRSTRRE